MAEEPNPTFGELLRERRLNARLTQAALAEQAGVSTRAIRELERGLSQPHRDTLNRIFEALELPPEERKRLQDTTRPTPRRRTRQRLGTLTLTFLFTDIVNSTRLWERNREQTRISLVRHDALIESVTAKRGGEVVRPRGEGDSRFCVFRGAADAATAAAEFAQALHAEVWPPEAPIQVRMALHTGEADWRDGDYYGSAVNRCAHIRSIAHAGQILVSGLTADLLERELPNGVGLRDLGLHRLKGFAQPERVFQLLPPGVPDEFPPLPTPYKTPNNLPIQVTPLVGRTRLLDNLQQRLLHPDTRLLTLTGAGGTGKTRVALQLAANVLDMFEHGVWFVSLATINDPSLVLPAVAQLFGVREEHDRTLADSVRIHIGEKPMLLVVDNFEQVTAAGSVLSELLRACKRLKILVTSRAVLALYGEITHQVPPLELPSDSIAHVPDAFAEVEAIQLFVQRAQSARADFALTDANAATVGAICQILDGLPLAIELAAARVRLLAPDALLARLTRRLALLTTGPRDGVTRHQTLRAAIEWSYGLLDPTEQAMFRRLATNVGGWMLSAAEAVCDTGEGGSLDVLGTLASLVDKSLITQDLLVSGDDPRFSMLETIREYALERLEASGEAPRVRDQHTVCYLHFAETAAARVDDGQPDWIERLEREHDNMRAALEWASRHQQAETALRLAAALASFWLLRGHLSEGRRWLDLALASSGGVPPALRARALHAAGQLAQYQSDFDTAEALGNESLFLYQSLGDKPACVASLQALARVARLRGQLAPSRALYEQSLAVATEIGDRSGAARALLYMAVSSWWQGDGAAARPLLEEALATFRAVGDPRGVADALNNLAWVSMTDGDYTQARVLHEDALAASHELGDQRGIARTLHGIGALAMSRGDYDEADVLFRKSLAGFLPLGERWFMYMNLVGLATVAHRREQALLAAALLGTADRVWESLAATEASRAAWEFSQTQPTLEAVRHELGEERFAAVWLRGRGMSPERALALQHEDSALDSGIPMLEGFGC